MEFSFIQHGTKIPRMIIHGLILANRHGTADASFRLKAGGLRNLGLTIPEFRRGLSPLPDPLGVLLGWNCLEGSRDVSVNRRTLLHPSQRQLGPVFSWPTQPG